MRELAVQEQKAFLEITLERQEVHLIVKREQNSLIHL